MGMAGRMTTEDEQLGYVVPRSRLASFLANRERLRARPLRFGQPESGDARGVLGTFIDPAKEATAANALLEQGRRRLGVIVDSRSSVVQTAEKRNAYSIGYHYIGVQNSPPKGMGQRQSAFTWGNLYTRFAKQVMDGTWKSEDILGGLGRRPT